MIDQLQVHRPRTGARAASAQQSEQCSRARQRNEPGRIGHVCCAPSRRDDLDLLRRRHRHVQLRARRRARRRHGWTRRSARAATGPTRSRSLSRCAVQRLELDEQLRARGACSRPRRRPSPAPPPTAAAQPMTSTRASRHASFSATRSSALRARGLRRTSASLGRGLAADELQARLRRRAAAPAGARARDRAATARCMKRLTARSSSEWKLMATSRPPGASTSSAPRRPRSSCPSSSLMNMRSAWKVRVAGCLPGSRVRTARATSSASCAVRVSGVARARALDDGLRHAAREALLAEGGDHLAYLVDARPSEPGADRLAACRVHAHVERAVGAEAEAAAPGRRAAARRRRGRRARPGKGDPARVIGTSVPRSANDACTSVSRTSSAKRSAAGRDGLRIPVEREHAAFSTQGLENECRMAAAPERRIDIVTARFQGQPRERLCGKHWCVLIHVAKRSAPAARCSSRCGLPAAALNSLPTKPTYSDSDSSSDGRSVAASSFFSHRSRRSFQRASSHSSKRLPWPISIPCRPSCANSRSSGGSKHPAVPVEGQISRVAHHQPLQPARRRIQARQAHQLAFDQLPLGQGINEEALVLVDGDHQLPCGELVDLLPVAVGHDHPPLVVQGDFCCTAKHDL